MLYTTTRSNRDAYTVHRALCEDVAPDGGGYLPLRFPKYGEDALSAMCQRTLNENIAEILNAFFSVQLTGWDIDFCIGRNAVRLKTMAYKVAVAELWHNTEEEFNFAIKSLYSKIAQNSEKDAPSEWFAIAVRIALFFAAYCEQCRQGSVLPGDLIDISVPEKNGACLMAVCYAKQMGLPVGTIVCTSEDSPVIWDLIHKGEVLANGFDKKLALTVERFLQYAEGLDTASAWRKAVDEKRMFSISRDEENTKDYGVYCVVTSRTRCDQTINSIFRSNGYMVDPYTAVSFAGLQDYRTKSTSGRPALVLAEHSPLKFAANIAAVTGIAAEKISAYIDNSL